uniref:AIG1-type G domain-containing protein n=1 Tax=Amphimedon queenslandica TaxID=400682 RepID=A0A1X7TKA3_AMPQE
MAKCQEHEEEEKFTEFPTDGCTTEVEVFEKEINGIPVVVFDSPGLQDNTSKEEEYIRSMKKTCKKLSLVLYCTKMTNTRLGDDDKKAMIKLTQAFGQGFWNHAVFVLTFANMEQVDRKDDRDINEPLEEPPIHDTAAWASLEKRRFEGRSSLTAVDEGDDQKEMIAFQGDDDLPNESKKPIKKVEIEGQQKVDAEKSAQDMPPSKAKVGSKCDVPKEKPIPESLSEKEYKQDESSSMSPVHDSRARLKPLLTSHPHRRPPPPPPMRPRSVSFSIMQRRESLKNNQNSILNQDTYPNIPCEDTSDKNIITEDNETPSIIKLEAEKKSSVGFEPPIKVTTDYANKMSETLLEKKLGRIMAQFLIAAFKQLSTIKPSQWFIKQLRKKKLDTEPDDIENF